MALSKSHQSDIIKNMPPIKTMKQIGKIGRRNIIANRRLKKEYERRQITACEICGGTFGLSFHHKKQRAEYIKYPKKLSEFSETILLDIKCHDKMHDDKELNKKTFEKLRRRK